MEYYCGRVSELLAIGSEIFEKPLPETMPSGGLKTLTSGSKMSGIALYISALK